MRLRFLVGFDDPDNIKQILVDARTAKIEGRLMEWTSYNVGTTRIGEDADIDEVIWACEQFLRTFDSAISKANPIMKRSKPILFI